MKLIKREDYLERLKNLIGTPDIKIITGVRRSGKSKLMEAFISYLESNKSGINIISIDFNNLAFENLKEYHSLNEYVTRKYVQGKTNYLFIDEVQECPNFEKAITSLHADGKYDIYLTGSNAFLLSSDLATYFTGRYIEIKVYPFSFKEFLSYFSDSDDIDLMFDKYVYMGGMPGSYAYSDESDRKSYLKSIYATIINKDLLLRYKIKNLSLIDQITEYLMDNISNLTNAKRISDVLTADKTETNHTTVSNYLKYLCNAFLFYKIKRYDIKGHSYLKSSDKYYLSDHGFRYGILGNKEMDYGRIYENIVCIELLRRGYDVYAGELYQKEIDFVAKKPDEQIYIQVSDDISTEATLQREKDSLLKIKDAYPKIIIARTKHDEYQTDGIKVYDIAKWLLL